MSKKIRRYVWLAAILAPALAIAACSSSKKSGDTSGSTAASASKGTVTIGLTGNFTGATSANSGSVPKLVSAWADTKNAAGGLAGYKIRIVTKDIDLANPASGLTAAKDLIDNEHALAIIDYDTANASWLGYAEKSGVPVLSESGGSSLVPLQSPNVFSNYLANPATFAAIMNLAKAGGGKLAIGYCTEACGGVIGLAKAFSDAVGVNIVLQSSLSFTAPDYTAFCQNLKSSGATGFWLIGATAPNAKITKQCYDQGVRLPQFYSDSDVRTSWLTDPTYDGAVTFSGVPTPWWPSGTSALTKEYRTFVAKIGTFPAENDGSYLERAYIATKQLEKAASMVTGALTSAAIKTAFYSFKGETLGGLTQPLTYSDQHGTGLTCYYVWKISNGQFTVPPGGADAHCQESVVGPVMDPILKAAPPYLK